MHRPLSVLVLGLAIATAAGCKHREEAAKQEGADLVQQHIQQPIDRARAANALAEKTAPALLDTSAQVYHKPGCKNADPSSMETVTVGQAESRGAKPDPACFPPAQ